MTTNLALIFIIIKVINCVDVTFDESTLPTETVTILSNITPDTPIMSNVSLHCFAKFKCLNQSCYSPVPEIHWLLPRELREFQILHGSKSARIEFSKQSINNGTTFLIRSAILIKDLGTLHNGNYICSHDYITYSSIKTIKFRGHNSKEKCNFDDQCIGYNCYENNCKCDENNQVFIAGQNSCLTASNWNSSCTDNKQCTYMKPRDENSTICSKNLCSCGVGYTPCVIPLRGKSCLRIASLGEECLNSDQCSKNDIHSYCPSKNKCQCKDGYYEESKQCKPQKKCDSSQLGFNDNMTKGGGCGDIEFCRNGVCLCLSYNLASDGHCSSHSNDDNDVWYNKYGYYIVGGMSVILILVLVLIAYQIMQYRNERKSFTSNSRANSSDPLNRDNQIRSI